MPLFSKVFKSKDANKKFAASTTGDNAAAKPQWVDAWLRTRVDPEEVAELLHGCTQELKARALDIPFLLLPFRPSSDPSAARTFVRNYFVPPSDRSKLKGDTLLNELRMTEAMVLISVMKWCWARLPGGVVSWETYSMFKVGEKDTKYAQDSFHTFIPISVDSDARVKIIFDFFDLLAALAAHGKTNGLSGHKLSRYAGWWAFEHYDSGKGFEAGYKAWSSAADATCHLFFAYLRSQSPKPGKTNGILDLPRSLQQLVAATSYPPSSSLLSNATTKVVMVVDVVSPTPYALLRRAKNFEYRDDDRALQHFADYDDPVDALTDECKRVLRAISTTNQSQVSDAKTSTSLVDPSWSRFEDIGFSSALDDIGEDDKGNTYSSPATTQSLNTFARSPVKDLNRPTTPSWADFLSSGFTDENGNKTTSPVLLPPDKMLPPINAEPRGQSSQSHRRNFDANSALEPGELASITRINVDDSFWWVWISSLAGEEPTSRKACFGRCALIETSITDGKWMVMEEQVKGAAPEPVQGAYIAEKKSFLGFTTKRGRILRRKSGVKKSPLSPNGLAKPRFDNASSATLAPDQQARIQRAALELKNKKKVEEAARYTHHKRGERDDPESRANSIFTLGSNIKDEASPAMQWAKQYDKNAIRAQYLGNQFAGKGTGDFLNLPANGLSLKGSTSTLSDSAKEKDLPTVPREEPEIKTDVMPEIAADLKTAAISEPSVKPQSEVTKEQSPQGSTQPHPAESSIEPTPLPEQPVTAMTTEPANEAAAVALPPPTPEPERVEALPEVKDGAVAAQPPATADSYRSHSRSPEQTRKKSLPADLQPAQRPNGIKRLLGNMRKNKEDTVVAPPPAPKANPAVAAARRALEDKINPPSPVLVQNNFAKYKGVKTPIAAAAVVTPVPEHTPSSEPTATTTQTKDLLESKRDDVEEQVVNDSKPASVPSESDHQPPVTRRDEEFDNLSRVDTKEQQQAEVEFSRFDQGPLLDQPATLPDNFSRDHETLSDEDGEHAKHQSIYSTVTMPIEDTDEDEDEGDQDDNDEDHKDSDQADSTQEANPNDRWAQIRRNAAERAARFSDDRGTRSRTETRTDDGETSGEETIESRVARIKARVAELTGNMEGVRR